MLAAIDRDPAALGVGAIDLDEIMRSIRFVLREHRVRLAGLGLDLAGVRGVTDRLQRRAALAGDEKPCERHLRRRLGRGECDHGRRGEKQASIQQRLHAKGESKDEGRAYSLRDDYAEIYPAGIVAGAGPVNGASSAEGPQTAAITFDAIRS